MQNFRAEFEENYKNAIYAVEHETEIIFKIGEDNEQINDLLKENNAETFAFITAYNPFSQILTDEENNKLQAALMKEIEERDYRFFKGYGTSEDENWEREESLFILEIEEKEAVKIASKYNQNAIVFGKLGEIIKLVWSRS